MKINIVKEFSDTPGGRKIDEGEFSGELFRDELLIPRYIESVEKKEKLEIYFDGAFGYPPSFLDEAFGGLVKKLKIKNSLENIILISKDDMSLERRVRKYVLDAEATL